MKKIMCAILGYLALSYGCYAEEAPVPEHVFLIGIDGLPSYAVTENNTPTLCQMMREGSWTLEKRSIFPSLSAPNWCSLFMSTTPETHGYVDNYENRLLPPVADYKNNRFPCIFQVLRESLPDLKMGYIYEWVYMQYYADIYSTDYYTDCGSDYIDHPKRCSELSQEYIRQERPNFMAIIYASSDDIGHFFGYQSAQYNGRLHTIDAEIRNIINATKEAGIYEKSIFVVTTDHGATELDHGSYTSDEIMTPLIFMGPGINKDHQIKSHTAIYDIIPTLTMFFGVDKHPLWIGRPIMDVFIQTDGNNAEPERPSENNATIVESRYFDLSGRRYSYEPENGVVIRQDIRSNGTFTTTKYARP